MNQTTESIWSQLSHALERFIQRRVAADVADDLLQETFLRIHQSVDKLEEPDRLAAWVYRIARNVIHDHYRAQNDNVSMTDRDVADTEDRQDQLQASPGIWLDELINELPSAYQEAVRLSEIDELPQHEVADRLGLSVSGAKSRVQRGRAMLRGVLDRCCVFHLDGRGNVTDCDPKPDRTVCRDCGDLEIPLISEPLSS